MPKNSNNKWRGRFFRYAPLVFWAGFILYLGSSAGSMSNTSRFVGPLLRFLFPGASEETIEFYHLLIRKSAHFFEYALLAFFAARAFKPSSLKFFSSNWFLAAFSCVFWIAIIDEIDQSFEPGRTSSPWDVLLDLSGGFVMLVLFYAYKKLFTAEERERD